MGKRPLYLLGIHVHREINRSLELKISDRLFDEVEDFFRFYIVPRKGDTVRVGEKYFEVLFVEFEGYKKSFAHPTFYKEGKLHVIEIGNKSEYDNYIEGHIAQIQRKN